MKVIKGSNVFSLNLWSLTLGSISEWRSVAFCVQVPVVTHGKRKQYWIIRTGKEDVYLVIALCVCVCVYVCVCVCVWERERQRERETERERLVNLLLISKSVKTVRKLLRLEFSQTMYGYIILFLVCQT
jgi:hypothetical protein